MSHIGVNLGFGNLHENMADEQMYAGEVAIAELADRLGFDSLWAVEHHFDDYAMCPDNVLFLAHVAGRTQRVQLGTGAVILPWNDPLRVAEKMIMLDILSGGRAVFGMGRGLSRIEYAPFRIPMSESRARFDEAAAMIAAALETGWIEGDGPYYPQPRVQLRPGPRGSFRDRLYCVAMSPDSIVSTAALLRQVGLEAAAEAAASVALFGTPDQILRQVSDIRDVLGDFQLIVIPSFGGLPYDQATASLELFAKEVMPGARELQGF
jgi:alkanesulfonate monooxygenase SsuD/methylene tetrahydromethanopterin reductase-like flavin-dependent oxidoreductase (luciferase family)